MLTKAKTKLICSLYLDVQLTCIAQTHFVCGWKMRQRGFRLFFVIGVVRIKARLGFELVPNAKKASILGSKLKLGLKGLGSSSIQFCKFRLGSTYRGGTESSSGWGSRALYEKSTSSVQFWHLKDGLDSVFENWGSVPPLLCNIFGLYFLYTYLTFLLVGYWKL